MLSFLYLRDFLGVFGICFSHYYTAWYSLDEGGVEKRRSSFTCRFCGKKRA